MRPLRALMAGRQQLAVGAGCESSGAIMPYCKGFSGALWSVPQPPKSAGGSKYDSRLGSSGTLSLLRVCVGTCTVPVPPDACAAAHRGLV
jgi:hypothetical protein